jgi:hypothetical protein
MRWESYNRASLALAKLARRAAHVVALGRWANNNDGPAGWGF